MNNEAVTRRWYRGRTVLCALLVFALTGMTHAESDDPKMTHQHEYEAAIATVLEGTSRIREEMQRILQDEVAHYDFLQYEHIELIRHARALAHPPATLDEADRRRIPLLPGEVVEAANELEWIIAGFLRAQALEEIREKNPGSVTAEAGASPESLMQQLDGAAVAEAAGALQRRYEAGSSSQ